MTDLARQRGPFAPHKRLSLEYLNELSQMGGATNFTSISVCCNDLYDFDRTNYFGNKQPLYFDSLCSASGPYKSFKVISWETTYTVVNTSASCPITVWAIPPVSAAAEIDSAAEADNFPGVMVLYLTPLSGSASKGTVTVKGHIDDVYDNFKEADATLIGTYSASPASQVFGGLCVHGSDGSTAPTVYIAIRHVAYVEFSQIDALVS
jgi:hypothetical protein